MESNKNSGEETPKKPKAEKKARLPKSYKPKKGERVLDKTTEYQIVLDENKNEADLHFSLNNPVSDRFFAYSLTLMDLFRTMEEVRAIAPPDVCDDFNTAVKVLKGMTESIRGRVEEEEGLKKPMLDDEKREKIKKMLKSVKEKVEKRFPGAKVVQVPGKVGSPEEMAEVIKKLIKDAEDEMRNEIEEENPKKSKRTKKTKPDSSELERGGFTSERPKGGDQELF